MIRKTIFQTWSTQNLPTKLEKLHNKMRLLNPEFEHIIYTDEQMNDYMNAEADKEIAEVYWKLNHIVARADVWRYTILLNRGGVYLDIDSQITGSLNELINNQDKAIITPEPHSGLFIQWALIFEKNHIFLDKTLNNILRDVNENKNKFDHHALTVGNYAKAIFNISKDNNIDFNWLPPNKQQDVTYDLSESSFRIVGNDYHHKFKFKHKYNHLLRNRPKGTEVDTHWSRFEGPIFE
jgi:inositol phosphorylceramide mannosyltransferase catalytic subunit